MASKMALPDGMVLRDATEADAGAVAEIYNDSIAIGDATMDSEPKTVDDIVGWLRGFGDRETLMVLDEPGVRVQGWGVIKRYSDRHGYRFACETAVYLRRDLLGRRLGTQIKLALIERCRAYGYHHLVAKIFADNQSSIAYNQKLGYEVVGVQRQIGWKNDRWQDVAILQLVLDQPEPIDS